MTPNAELRTRYFQTADGIRLHARTCGPEDAPVLLFVHGFPEYWGAWRKQLAAFRAHYHCVAIDMRGFNLSSQPLAQALYKPALLLADLAAVITSLGAPVHAVIAHDWGGALAWSLAAQQPQLMHKLVVLNAPHAIAFAQALAFDPEQQAAGQYMNALRSPGFEHTLAQSDFQYLWNLLGPLTDAEKDDYRACWRHGLTGGCNYYRASPLHPDTTDAPGKIAALAAALNPADFQVHVPTQLIWGMADHALRPSLLRGIENHVSDLRLHRIQDAGHWLLRSHADEVNQVIREFLDQPTTRDTP